jgi:hypothetical protein
LTTECDAHVERIMAMQIAEGQLPYPLMQPIPQPRLVFAKRPRRPVHAHTPQSTGDPAAASSPKVPEEAEDPAVDVPTRRAYERQEEVPRGHAAVQPALRRLPVPVPQQQLPVHLVQPMRFENAGEQRS